MSSIIGALKVILSAETADFSKPLNQAAAEVKKAQREIYAAGAKMSKIGGQLSSVGRTLSIGLTAPLVAIGATAAKAAVSFESAFAGVRKTVDATEAEFQKLAQGFRDMSKEMPVTAEEFSRIGEAAGQLGIHKENILGFSKVMAELGVTTNLSSDEAATALARLANITGMSQGDFDRLGSTIVDLGNNFATTEREIVEMGLRIAGAGSQIGLSEHQILAYATALSSVGIRAEAGGTAISRVMISIAQSVAKGGEKLQEFARIAGMSVADFKTQFEKNAAVAVQRFIEGLGQLEGSAALNVLDELGLDAVRVRDVLLRAAGAGKLLGQALQTGADAWKANTALTAEAQKRFETTASQLIILKNQLVDVARIVGGALKPVLDWAIERMKSLIPVLESAAKKFSELPKGIQIATVAVAGLVAAFGPLMWATGGVMQGLGPMLTLLARFGPTIATSSGPLAGLAKGALTAAGGVAALKVGVIAAAGVIAAQGTRALTQYGDSLRGIQDPTREAVNNVGLLKGAWVILGDAANALGRGLKWCGEQIAITGKLLMSELVDNYPAVREFFDGIKTSVDLSAVALSHLSDGLEALGRKIYGVNEENIRLAGEMNKQIAAAKKSLEGLKERGGFQKGDFEWVAKEFGLSMHQVKYLVREIENAGKATKDVGKAVGQVTKPGFKPLGDEAQKAAEEIAKLRDQMSGRGMTAELSKMSQAIGSSLSLIPSEAERVAKAVQEALEQGLEPPENLMQIWRQYTAEVAAQSIRGIREAIDSELGKLSGGEGFALSLPSLEGISASTSDLLLGTIQEAAEKTGKSFESFFRDAKGNSRNLTEAWKAAKEALAGVGEETDKNKEKTFDWTKALQVLTNIFQLFGISAESSLGRIAAGLTTAGAAAQQMKKALEAEDWLGFAASGGQAILGFTQAIDQGTASARALGGALSGAAIGSQIGSAAGPLGAVIGGAAGGLIGGVVGAFKKPGWKKAMESVGKEFGVDIKEGLAREIEELGKSLKIGRAEAALLSISKIAEESGRSIATMGPSISKLFQGVATGVIPAKEGIQELANVFSTLAEGGPSRALYDFITQARQLDLEIPGLAQHISDSLSSAAEGLGTAFANLVPENLEELKAQAEIAALTFMQIYKEKGVAAAGEAFAGIAEKLRESMEALGVEEGGLGGLLGPMFQAVGLASNEAFAAASNAAAGFTQTLTGLMNAAVPMAAGQINAFGNQAQAAFNKAKQAALDQGMSVEAANKAAFAAVGPLLGEIVRASQIYGTELDANTAALVEQAQKAGIAFPVDPVMKMTEAVNKLIDTLRELHNIPPYDPTAGSGPTPPGSPPPGRQHGSGGWEDFGRGTTMVLHGIESAIRPEDLGPNRWLGESIVEGIRRAMPAAENGSEQPIYVISNIHLPFGEVIRSLEKAQKANMLRVLPEQVRAY